GLEGLVEGGQRLLGPRRLGTAPADRDYRRLIGRIMNRGSNRVEKPLIRVGREIHRNVRRGSNRAGNLDIQHHLAVRSVRITSRLVFPVVDGYRGDLGERYAKSGKVRLQIRRPIAAAELDYADAFARSRAGGIVIERCHLNRRERIGSRMPLNVATELTPEMRFRLRAIIQAEHAFDFAVKFVG